MRYFLFIAIIIVLFSSCEKDITVDLPQPEEQLVIEGYIEPGQPPYVLISKTAPYFSAFDENSLLQYVVKNAKVTVQCVEDNITDTLLQVLADTGYFYVSFSMLGQVGKTYNLRVETEDGKVATATTRIEPPIPLDSIWFKIQEGKDSLGFVWAHLTDPDTLGNNYRWFAKRIGKDSSFIAPIGSVFEDKFINGKSFDFAYNRGSVPNSIATDDTSQVEGGFFKTGDVIVVKFCTITKESFKFWRSAETQSSNIGNPFASITPLISNIEGGIGIWEGYSPSLDTVIAQ
ncbi:MAG TPA: DUF4249 domain-containing protein [Bacteroidia bacterium]|nr:DUF4249 domain-containing protein [Bacteroidia bacterium]HNU33115.1 DUF4249 domain-containing protein [Bacteroidia bacterium]